MNVKEFLERLSLIDEDHFAVVSTDCVEIYEKSKWYQTPTGKETEFMEE